MTSRRRAAWCSKRGRRRRRTKEKLCDAAWCFGCNPSSTQITPVVELVGVFGPAVADVGAVVHVGDKDVFDAGIDLSLSLLHGLADADNDQHNAGGAGNQPLAVHFLYVFDVNAFHVGFLEDDSVVLREG